MAENKDQECNTWRNWKGVGKGGDYAQNDEFRGFWGGFFTDFEVWCSGPASSMTENSSLERLRNSPAFSRHFFHPFSFPCRVWWRIAPRGNLPWERISSWIRRNWDWEEIKKGKSSSRAKGHIQRQRISSSCSSPRVRWGISLSWKGIFRTKPRNFTELGLIFDIDALPGGPLMETNRGEIPARSHRVKPLPKKNGYSVKKITVFKS